MNEPIALGSVASGRRLGGDKPTHRVGRGYSRSPTQTIRKMAAVVEHALLRRDQPVAAQYRRPVHEAEETVLRPGRRIQNEVREIHHSRVSMDAAYQTVHIRPLRQSLWIDHVEGLTDGLVF